MAYIPIDEVKAHISQSDSHQILFMEFDNDIEVPDHSHGAQWRIVVAGEIELTIEGAKRTFKKGDNAKKKKLINEKYYHLIRS